MSSWNDLSSSDLGSLVAYVKSLASDKSKEKALEPAEAELAKALFVKNCAGCHGASGKGDGPTATPMAPMPTNFHEVRPTREYSEAVLENGIPGTSMPQWEGKLKDSERRLLIHYIRSLYEPESSIPKE